MRKIKTQAVSFFLLFVFIGSNFFFFSTAFSQQDDPAKLEAKLAELSAEEKKILEELFALTQSIDAMEKEKQKTSLDMENLQLQISRLEAEIAAEEQTYNENRKALKEVLKSYQRTGPSTYLERLLKAKSFSDFLRRIGTLRDLARNTGKLLELLQASKEKLEAQKEELVPIADSLRATQRQLAETIDKTNRLKTELENSLAALAEEREFFEERLAIIDRSWQELTQFFPQLTSNLARIMAEAELPPEAIKLTFTPAGVKAAITDITLNNLLDEHGFSELQFTFVPGKVQLAVPARNLILSGAFLVEDKVLKFHALEGTFYGMALNESKREELFASGELLLDLSQLVGEFRILAIEAGEGQLELTVVPLNIADKP